MPEPIIKSPRKLIEVALPLDAINESCAKEKSIRHGHPSTLHLWWARRPLAAARAVIFSQLVNDPAGLWEQQNPGLKPSIQQRGAFTKRRQELFNIIEALVLWENTTNETVLGRARAEIQQSWKDVCELNKDHPNAAELFNPGKMPGLHDPFAGGGAIPLEAQRLGLDAFASDLNPVPVIINKAMIEIPALFAKHPPVSLIHSRRGDKKRELDLGQNWPGATGLAEDVRHYGTWVREEGQKRIGHLYPSAEITPEVARGRPDLEPLIGEKLNVVAWIWARTVKSPNPAFSNFDVPLASTFILSSKEGRNIYIEPEITNTSYQFAIKTGTPTEAAKRGTKAGGAGTDFLCLLSGTPIGFNYLREEAKQGRMGQRLMATVAEGTRGRVYLPPTEEMEMIALEARPAWIPDTPLPDKALGFRVQEYGMLKWSDLFTNRQLVALSTFSDLVLEVRKLVEADAIAAGMSKDLPGLDSNGTGAKAYSEAVCVYLSLAVSKMSDAQSSLCRWKASMDQSIATFGRHALPMVWDFSEANALGGMAGDFLVSLSNMMRVLDRLGNGSVGTVKQADAQTQTISKLKQISTDPPYYDNIGYADLSDFFYVWLRRSLRDTFPSLLSTIAVPKAEELVATPFRHGNKEKAANFFLDGMTRAMSSLAKQAHPAAPITIYYAFKQSDTEEESGTSSTGWVTFLEAVNRSGLQLSGTWPMRTELGNRQIASGNNALASSIVLVCRKRPENAPSISRREFVRELNSILPQALDEMTKGSGEERSPVAPVDLSQAIIGPGMAVFSKYSSVLEADGTAMSVQSALQLINRFLAEDDFDADTQFCLSWFEQNGWKEGAFGGADTLARGKGTSVDGVKDAGVIQSGGGKVRLYKWSEYPADWDPLTDNRTPIWEALHHLIRALKRDGGETASGALLAALGGKAEAVRQLAYRLYTLCERLGQAEDARAYNELITSWTGIETAAAAAPKPTDGQLPGFENN
jgi:putative DNA methylase